jgi:hypothetical protein
VRIEQIQKKTNIYDTKSTKKKVGVEGFEPELSATYWEGVGRAEASPATCRYWEYVLTGRRIVFDTFWRSVTRPGPKRVITDQDNQGSRH